MAAKFYNAGLAQLTGASEAKGLAQIVGHGYHSSPNGNSNHYWTTYTTTTNTTALSQQLTQDTINAIKENLNRQIYGIYPAPQIDYSDYIVSKGIRELPNKIDILKLM